MGSFYFHQQLMNWLYCHSFANINNVTKSAGAESFKVKIKWRLLEKKTMDKSSISSELNHFCADYKSKLVNWIFPMSKHREKGRFWLKLHITYLTDWNLEFFVVELKEFQTTILEIWIPNWVGALFLHNIVDLIDVFVKSCYFRETRLKFELEEPGEVCTIIFHGNYCEF